MPESQTRLSGIFTLLAPYFERQKQKKREELAGMITKVLSGNATPEEISMLLANNPEALTTALATQQTQNKQQQEQWQLGEQRRLMGMLQPQQQQATMPTQQDITQAFSARQGGRFSNIPFPTPQPARTVYPQDEQYRNVAAQLEALGGSGLNIGKLLTERSQAGYYDAGAAERIAEAEYKTNLIQQVQAKTAEIWQDIEKKKQLLPIEIQELENNVNLLKNRAMSEAATVDNLKKEGNLIDARVSEQKVINEYLPAIKQAETALLAARKQSELADAGLTGAKTQQVKSETEIIKSGGAPGMVKATPLTSGQRNQLSKFAQKLEADSRKKGGLWHKDPEIKNRGQAEASAREFGLYDTNHPEVKAVLDRYFPEDKTTQAQSQGQAGMITRPKTAEEYLKSKGF